MSYTPQIGDIGLLHTEGGILPEAVQYFQQRVDEESGYYNHSFRYYGKVNGIDVILEAAPKEWGDNKGKLRKSGAYFNPLSIYEHDKYEILWLTPKTPYDADIMQEFMMIWEGTPYDFKNLLGDQVIQYLFGWWWGRKKRMADNLMVCHELTMKIDNEYSGIFHDWNKSKVEDIYRSEHFIHKT